MKKSDREIVRMKYNNKCAYCGTDLVKGWHVDEVEPVRRYRETIKVEDGNYICEMCRAVTLSVENNVKEIMEDYEVHVFDKNSVNIDNAHFNFIYTVADSVVKDEFKGQYRYFGGLQSNLDKDSDGYKLLEKTLCEIAEKELELFCNNTTHSVSVTGN